MKEYLVTCDLGAGYIDKCRVQTDDDYTPASDDMKRLKEEFIKACEPRRHWASTSSPSGHLDIIESNDRLSAKDLDVIAVSRLDI